MIECVCGIRMYFLVVLVLLIEANEFVRDGTRCQYAQIGKEERDKFGGSKVDRWIHHLNRRIQLDGGKEPRLIVLVLLLL